MTWPDNGHRNLNPHTHTLARTSTLSLSLSLSLSLTHTQIGGKGILYAMSLLLRTNQYSSRIINTVSQIENTNYFLFK